jgi:hypothetical protein
MIVREHVHLEHGVGLAALLRGVDVGITERPVAIPVGVHEGRHR